MRESCLEIIYYSGIQSLFEVVLLYTFYTATIDIKIRTVFMEPVCKGLLKINIYYLKLKWYLLGSRYAEIGLFLNFPTKIPQE